MDTTPNQHQCLSSFQPMTTSHKPLEEQLTALANDLATRGIPADTYDNHWFLQPLELLNVTDDYTTLHEKHFSQFVGGRNKTAAEELERHWQVFLLCLSGCAVTHRWLLVSLKKNHYSSDRWLKKHGLKYNATKQIVSYLEEAGLVIVKKGAKYDSNPMRTRLYPTPTFASQLLTFYLNTAEPFDGDYLQFEEDDKREAIADKEWAKTIKSLPKDHPDVADLNHINEFLEGQQWACKGPVRLKYKLTAFHGGRLYTRYQQLPDRKHKVRINTLINNEPMGFTLISRIHLKRSIMTMEVSNATKKATLGRV